MHCEPSRESGTCVANVAVFLKPTIFRGTVKLIQNVGSHEPLCLDRVVTHDEVFCLCALVVDVELQFVSVVFAGDAFLDDVFENSFVTLVFGIHKVTVVQIVSCVFRTRYVCVIVALVKLAFCLSVYVFVAVAVVYEKLFDS